MKDDKDKENTKLNTLARLSAEEIKDKRNQENTELNILSRVAIEEMKQGED